MSEGSIPIHDQKRALRREMRQARSLRPAPERREESLRVADHVLALPAWASAGTVLLYLALPEEVDTDALIEAALAQGKRLCLPRLEDDRSMTVVHVTSLEGVGFAGLPLSLRQPPPGVGEAVRPEEIDLNLAPCVAMDRAGYRLGLGGGHYDRFLPQMRPDAVSLGLIYGDQLLDSLPREPHDRPLHGRVTPDGASILNVQ